MTQTMDDTESAPDDSTGPHADTGGAFPPAGTTPPGAMPPGGTPPGGTPPGGTPPGAMPPFAGWTPPANPGGARRPARLRRSREDRVAVGLAGGLGRYFGVDPVLFRVVFGVLALFGGSGIVLYLLGWAAVPDEDTADAPIDRAIATLRRRHVPVSLVVGVGLVVVWLTAFSWWAPSSFIPAVVLVAVVVLFLMRGGAPIRAGEPVAYPAPAPYASETAVFAGAAYPATAPTAPFGSDGTAVGPTPAAGSELRTWFQESRAHARERRRRRRPVQLVAVLAIVCALVGLALVDVGHGVRLGSYFWALGGIVLVALVVGAALRRTPWPLLPLLVPAMAGLFVFGSTPVRAHDGWGDRMWTPVASGGVSTDYRIAFGRATLDLTGLPAPTATQSTSLRMGAGQIRVIVPGTVPVLVVADVHLGSIDIDGGPKVNGLNFTRTYLSPAARTHPDAPRLIMHIRMTSGQINLAYRG